MLSSALPLIAGEEIVELLGFESSFSPFYRGVKDPFLYSIGMLERHSPHAAIAFLPAFPKLVVDATEKKYLVPHVINYLEDIIRDAFHPYPNNHIKSSVNTVSDVVTQYDFPIFDASSLIYALELYYISDDLNCFFVSFLNSIWEKDGRKLFPFILDDPTETGKPFEDLIYSNFKGILLLDLAGFLNTRFHVMGKDRIKAGGTHIDSWTERDNISIHYFARTIDLKVISGANLHKVKTKSGSVEYQISMVFTHPSYEKNSVGGRLITRMVKDILSVDPDATIFLNARCPHDLINLVDSQHQCEYEKNKESQVRFYYQLGFEVDYNNLEIGCHSGIGNIRMVYTGNRDGAKLHDVLRQEHTSQRPYVIPQDITPLVRQCYPN